MDKHPIEYAGDEPLFWPFLIWLATVFLSVFAGLLIGFATWGI